MAIMGCTHDKLVLGRDDLLEEAIPLDLGRLPALRYLKFRAQNRPIGYREDVNMLLLDFLNRLLSTSTSSSGIETLEIGITYKYAHDVYGKNFFLPDGWSRLDHLFASEKFVSLRKVVLSLVLEMGEIDGRSREVERDSTLPYVSALFPMLRALADTQHVDTQRTLEIHLSVA